MRSFETDPRGPYVRMYSGRQFFLTSPRVEDVHVDDIARHLAGISRYTGGTRYSVAQHCVAAARMAEIFYPEYDLLPAQMLIHDASEAYYGDVASPLKAVLPEYRALEDVAQKVIETRFDCWFTNSKAVKEVDFRMWLTERDYLLPNHPDGADYDGPLKPFKLDAVQEHYFDEWPADMAEAAWLNQYERLFCRR
jgi:hypothetical protein